MKYKKILFAALFSLVAISLSLFAQAPLSDNMAASGVLGASDFVTNTNYASASTTTLAEPFCVAIDPTTGKLFVADRDNRRVLRWSSADKLVDGSAAEAVLGQPDFVTRTANTGGISAATMNNPNSIHIDANGRLWVADRDNNRVLRFDNASSKTSGASADGVLGQLTFGTSTANCTPGTMSAPRSVFVDGSGRLWVADGANNRVTRFDNAAAKANGGVADGVLGQSDLLTGTTGLTASTMNAPWGVHVDAAGRLWVAERNNNRVTRFDNAAAKANGASADGVLGQTDFTTGTTGLTQSKFDGPRGVFVDGFGRLYVGDEGNSRVMIFNGAAVLANGANAANVLGQPDFVTTGSATSTTGLNYPSTVFIDHANNRIWIPDTYSHRIVRYDVSNVTFGTSMAASGVLGASDFVTNTNYASASTTTLAEPFCVAIDPTTGKLFVADRDNRRVLRWSSADKLVDGSAAEAVLGQPDFVTRTANTGGISAATMNNPNSIHIDANGRLWVADRDNNRVLRFDNASSKTSGASADGVLGQLTFGTSTANCTPGTMSAPRSVFVDGSGRLWVADGANNRVTRFDNAAAKANGGVADGVLGQSDLLTGTTGLTASTMNAPWGVHVDAAGRLWVAERNNNRVTRFDNAAAKANGASADGVLGQTDFTTGTTGLTQSKFDGPRGVFVDGFGRLYVGDEGNSRVMIFNGAAVLANGANAANVLGQPDFVTTGSATSTTGLNYPSTVFVDNSNNHIWIPDTYSHRIVRFDVLALPVELVSFTATIRSGKVELAWATATEINNAGFAVEKNTNNVWNKIGYVEGNGTTNAPKNYSFTDNAASGKIQYRLKQIDRDGKFEYSNIVEATIALTANDYTLGQNYPNPFNPSTTITFAMKNNEHATVTVYNMLGQVVAVLFNGLANANEQYSLTFDAKNLSSGIYFYSLQSANRNEVKKMSLLK